MWIMLDWRLVQTLWVFLWLSRYSLKLKQDFKTRKAGACSLSCTLIIYSEDSIQARTHTHTHTLAWRLGCTKSNLSLLCQGVAINYYISINPQGCSQVGDGPRHFFFSKSSDTIGKNSQVLPLFCQKHLSQEKASSSPRDKHRTQSYVFFSPAQVSCASPGVSQVCRKVRLW